MTVGRRWKVRGSGAVMMTTITRRIRRETKMREEMGRADWQLLWDGRELQYAEDDWVYEDREFMEE